jgi:hypothetical protein
MSFNNTIRHFCILTVITILTACNEAPETQEPAKQAREESPLKGVLEQLESSSKKSAPLIDTKRYTCDEKGVRFALSDLTALGYESQESYRRVVPLKQAMVNELKQISALNRAGSPQTPVLSSLVSASEAYATGLESHVQNIESRYLQIRKISEVCNLTTLPKTPATTALIRRFIATEKVFPAYRDELSKTRARIAGIKGKSSR